MFGLMACARHFKTITACLHFLIENFNPKPKLSSLNCASLFKELNHILRENQMAKHKSVEFVKELRKAGLEAGITMKSATSILVALTGADEMNFHYRVYEIKVYKQTNCVNMRVDDDECEPKTESESKAHETPQSMLANLPVNLPRIGKVENNDTPIKMCDITSESDDSDDQNLASKSKPHMMLENFMRRSVEGKQIKSKPNTSESMLRNIRPVKTAAGNHKKHIVVARKSVHHRTHQSKNDEDIPMSDV
ncbi:hypothetical protein Ciccas_013615 [Cichlidogyrus casuarinus]|uniref:Uncharacterized protein n=1 Tax=Cichlidogyrus casuarinus TaxID=1844966 RepID=A0ABD2PK49_9PLAT